MNQTTVVLSQNNYRIVGEVSGEAKGSSAHKLVRENAYADMMKNANLQGSQAIININYERITKTSGTTYIKVTGTIIEFTK